MAERKSLVKQLELGFSAPWQRKLFGLAQRPLCGLLGLSQMDRISAAAEADTGAGGFFDKALRFMGVQYHLTPEDLTRIPKTGPAVVVANHPFGAIEGVILAALLKQLRPDVRILTNYILKYVPLPEDCDLFIYVDAFGGKDAKSGNRRPMREAISWTRKGGMLVIFPAGEVSHLRLRDGGITDPPWSDHVGRLVKMTNAPVVPMYFAGANSAMFHAAGLVHPRLRTALIPREFLNKSGKTLELRVGSSIPAAKLATFDRDQDVTAYMRLRTYLLANREPATARALAAASVLNRRKSNGRELAPLIAPVDPALLEAEVLAMQPKHELLESGHFVVLEATRERMPNIMRELGRLRELTFRANDEGTGKETDLDSFDDYYHHLFIWHADRREVVGAYRIGHADEILLQHGQAGMYSYTLFHYDPDFHRVIRPALELGRSFIRPEYQRNYQPLLMLWKGIAAYLVRYPHYRYLYGPVSINSDYKGASHQLMVDYLQFAHFERDLSRCVRARTPFRKQGVKNWRPGKSAHLLKDLDDISAVVTDVESGEKGIPVLLRQYLKLGGKILGFNLDPDFSNCLDGLVLVDLLNVDARVVERFMGKEGYATYKSHQVPAPAAAPLAPPAPAPGLA